MLKCICLECIRDVKSGKCLYKLDGQGCEYPRLISSTAIKTFIKTGKIEVVNITLTKNNRLIFNELYGIPEERIKILKKLFENINNIPYSIKQNIIKKINRIIRDNYKVMGMQNANDNERLKDNIKNNYLTLIHTKTGKFCLWYLDENGEIAINVRTGQKIKKEEILKYIC